MPAWSRRRSERQQGLRSLCQAALVGGQGGQHAVQLFAGGFPVRRGGEDARQVPGLFLRHSAALRQGGELGHKDVSC